MAKMHRAQKVEMLTQRLRAAYAERAEINRRIAADEKELRKASPMYREIMDTIEK